MSANLCALARRARARAAPHPYLAALWRHDPGTRRTWTILTLFCGLLAAAMLTWPARFESSAYEVIAQLGGRWWAAVWAGLAVALILARSLGLRAMYWALQLGGLAHLMWAVAIGMSAWTNPRTAWTGPLVFGALWAMHVSTALEHRHRPLPSDQKIGGAL